MNLLLAKANTISADGKPLQPWLRLLKFYEEFCIEVVSRNIEYYEGILEFSDRVVSIYPELDELSQLRDVNVQTRAVISEVGPMVDDFIEYLEEFPENIPPIRMDYDNKIFPRLEELRKYHALFVKHIPRIPRRIIPITVGRPPLTMVNGDIWPPIKIVKESLTVPK